MARLGPVHGVRLALLFCICSGAGAFRFWRRGADGQPEACSRLACKNLSVTFPIDVDGLLHTFHGDKSEYFGHLREIGVDRGLAMSAPHKVGVGCLGPAHFVFVGDSMSRLTFECFLRSGGRKVPVEQLAELDRLEESAAACSDSAKPRGLARRPKRVKDDAGSATYVWWLAGPIDEAFTDDLRDIVVGIRNATPGVQIVFWFDALVHGWGAGDLGWTIAGQRRELQTKLVSHVRRAFPRTLMVWDSPTFIDFPLAHAAPPNRNAVLLEQNHASRVSAALAAEDRRVMASLGVPLTLRWEVSNKYRGLQCDGLHATPQWGGRDWNCGGFPAYEELILQSGLQQLCLKRRMRLCE
uniref:Uncharacterized protein n=1 Tax=Alexandrium catenella TaxID=2925 RepID=A0A7S1S1Z3_ALECA|mmetsp:Transcript_80461/g.213568  ORF Transcript_80461/g.213568 Transcript_80461/m.213568 type:complete len:354 (+) Transcript_80461:122-1183(+)